MFVSTRSLRERRLSLAPPSQLWLPAALQPQPGLDADGNRTDGFASVALFTATPPDGLNVTGVRYAWSDVPCCPVQERDVTPCPLDACPITTALSRLPAVPFTATVGPDGKCDYISTQESTGAWGA